MSRIDEKFAELGQRKAFVVFVTAGDPTLEHTVAAMHALAAGGADIIELGIPFSDPEAEGPAIQASSERALANGMTLKKVLAMVAEFRERDTTTPIVLMGYLNSVLAMSDFPEQAAQAGVDGLIMVNLPPEEALVLKGDLSARNIDLIFLVAPTTTSARAKRILAEGSGFIYYVSLKGITGADHLRTDEVAAKLATLQTDLPICVGFGVKDPETAKSVAGVADGVVVGSALVNLMAEYPDDVAKCCAALEATARGFRAGIDAA